MCQARTHSESSMISSKHYTHVHAGSLFHCVCLPLVSPACALRMRRRTHIDTCVRAHCTTCHTHAHLGPSAYVCAAAYARLHCTFGTRMCSSAYTCVRTHERASSHCCAHRCVCKHSFACARRQSWIDLSLPVRMQMLALCQMLLEMPMSS